MRVNESVDAIVARVAGGQRIDRSREKALISKVVQAQTARSLRRARQTHQAIASRKVTPTATRTTPQRMRVQIRAPRRGVRAPNVVVGVVGAADLVVREDEVVTVKKDPPIHRRADRLMVRPMIVPQMIVRPTVDPVTTRPESRS